ncbi:MAG TPA: histidine kinase [Opitutaceae bacterium]
MHVSGPARHWLVSALIFTGFWLVVILAFAAQLVFTASFTWPQGIRGALFDWFPWVLLSPAVIWLALKFPLERGRLRASVPVHVASCVLSIAVGSLISEQFLPRPGPPPGAGWRSEGAPEGREPGWRLPPPDERPAMTGPGGQSRRVLPDRPLAGVGERRPGAGRDRRFWGVVLWSRSKINLPVYWVIVSVVHAFSLYRRVQERDRRALELSASLSKAKLQTLRLQMQPHFLFNTLNAISTLVHKDPDKADEMIVNLSELLRLSLEVSEQEDSLRHELEVLDRYLEIEQVRLGDRLRVEKEIEPEALDALVPSLMIQTIVENSIRHGIEPRASPGIVTLRAGLEEGVLRLQVVDDGVGIRPADRASERRGIGLANTESRLGELYGSGGRMALREPDGGGLMVEITLPFRPAGATDTGNLGRTA